MASTLGRKSTALAGEPIDANYTFKVKLLCQELGSSQTFEYFALVFPGTFILSLLAAWKSGREKSSLFLGLDVPLTMRTFAKIGQGRGSSMASANLPPPTPCLMLVEIVDLEKRFRMPVAGYVLRLVSEPNPRVVSILMDGLLYGAKLIEHSRRDYTSSGTNRTSLMTDHSATSKS
uniref:Uncharacterized protein n=1 Tax=Timema poppense TaxID=170557 RepID=A0A7R9DGL9_TIMPO|nr:unnamed protein product [Timema poppensis]